ncbi:MAG: hypothetical protein ACD_73C00349G0001 [uncultured bacterium]|nr:MAG: hypothetical protein ACD_73C00349G0001 [uncultured bacterium]
MKSPFGGEISLKLVSPFVMTRPYREDEPVKAPLIVKFRFLADIVDPKTLFSRQQFLTLATSPKIKNLRDSVKALAANGLSAYDEYLAALNTLLEDVRGVFPQASSTFDRAQKFLRDEVLLYFMGKKTVVGYAPLQHAEKTAMGDVIASVCSATADLLTSTNHESDALVELVDASHWAQTKPQFIGRIQQFFDALRSRMGEPVKQNTLALAQEFSERATIL